MDTPSKKSKPLRSYKTALFIGLVFLVIALGVLYLVYANKPPASIPTAHEHEEYLLHASSPGEISSIKIENTIAPAYIISQKEEGVYALDDYEKLPLNPLALEEMFAFAANVQAEEKIDLDQSLYDLRQEEFGLNSPGVTVTVTDKSNTSWAFSFGHQVPYENLYYFTYQGDSSVYLVELGYFDLYNVTPGYLVAIDQPAIHHQRISSLTIKNPLLNETLALSATQPITASDRLFSWRLLSPYQYPGDSQNISTLLESLENLYLGAYVGEATTANKSLYGFSPPSLALTLTLEEGTIAQVGSQGVFNQQTYPKETLAFEVGKQEDDFVYHILFNGHIYLASSLNIPLLQGFSPSDYLLKRPALLPLETLSSIKGENLAEKGDFPLVFNITHQPNNDQNGEESTFTPNQLTITLNNASPVDSVAFSTAYAALTQVSATGFLPEGFVPAPPAYRITMATTSGISRTIELSPYDALHDALTIDGITLFTLRKGELEDCIKALTPLNEEEALP